MATCTTDDVTVSKHVTENFTDFGDETLVDQKPVDNWPKLFGRKSAKIINEEGFEPGRPVKVLVVDGGVGRSTLELLINCKNLSIDHTDGDNSKQDILKQLLQKSEIVWQQQLEGLITETRKFRIEATGILDERGNSVNFFQVDWKASPDFEKTGYDVIIADIRSKNSGSLIGKVSRLLRLGGVLILGTIDDVHESNPGPKHSLHVLTKRFDELPQPSENSETKLAHIYKQTRNKHQYAISYFSAWRKTAEGQLDETQNAPNPDLQGQGQSTADYYEDTDILVSYDRFHFGEGLLGVKNFPLRMAEVCIQACEKYNVKMESALDAGCGPGRTALELCSVFTQVEAYDYSQGFVDMMIKEKLKRGIQHLEAYQGDSHCQEEMARIKKFDLIHGCNLIDRLHSPEKWVAQSKAMLNKDGLLVISSPYTWMEEHTPLSKWIGGFKKNGENFFTVDGLQELLQPELSLLEVHRIPFVIPDADGTFQYTYSNCTIFGFKN